MTETGGPAIDAPRRETPRGKFNTPGDVAVSVDAPAVDRSFAEAQHSVRNLEFGTPAIRAPRRPCFPDAIPRSITIVVIEDGTILQPAEGPTTKNMPVW